MGGAKPALCWKLRGRIGSIGDGPFSSVGQEPAREANVSSQLQDSGPCSTLPLEETECREELLGLPSAIFPEERGDYAATSTEGGR